MDKKKKIVVLAVCILLCLGIAGGTLAWYVGEDSKRGQSEAAQVMAPYNLYLMNPNAKDTLEFAVGNLHPGETKQVVICVSNKRPQNYQGDGEGSGDIAKDSEFGYDLMLAHTENLAVDYQVYPLERHDMTKSLPANAIIMEDDTKNLYYWTKSGRPLKGDDISADMRKSVFGNTRTDSIVNVGTYWRTDDDNMKLAYHENTGYEYNYYLIEVKWQGISNFDDYKKETDLVYVVVNAKQPRPVE